MTEVAPEKNCIDVVIPFRDELDMHWLPEVQIMGGIASTALTDYHTEIFTDERLIVTGPDFLEDPNVLRALRPIRAEDGTLRDLDVLVHSTAKRDINEVKSLAKQTVGKQLDISVFGLHRAAELRQQVAEPFGWQAVSTFVSDRYVWEDGHIDKSLFPFVVPLEREVLEGWRLQIGDEVFPVANPASTVLNYLTRSISGLRAKDAEKVYMMAGRVFRAAPELLEWTLEGPGKSQMELAGILQTLRRANSLPLSKRTLDVGGALEIRAGSVRALQEHEAFMLKHDDSDTRDAALAWALIKSRGLGIGESQEDIVKLFRRHFEGRVDGITKNSSDGRISLTAKQAAA